MVYTTLIASLTLAAAVSALVTPRESSKRDADVELLTDIHVIQTYWGLIKPYNDTPASFWGVENTGLPYGCGYEHGARYPTGSDEDSVNNLGFASKVEAIQANSSMAFSGPLAFLNTWKYALGKNLLLPSGAAQDYTSGTSFWNTRGRLLYNATVGQPYYNASFTNGTARPLPLLRTTSQERILDSALAWANGFFGPENATSKYNLLVIPEGGTENNTLASYDGCANDNIAAIGYTGDAAVFAYIPLFTPNATARVNAYLSSPGYSFNGNDTYAMMEICSYEYAAFGSSDFCGLFTESEWDSYSYTLDLEYYYDYSYGQATGRAQGIGYLQEVLARLNQEYITVSNSSVNSTLDNNATEFPLGQRFYMDMSHDDILVSVITAESVQYFNTYMPISYPPPSDRTFRLGYMTPFGTRLYTEVIGCSSANPAEVQTAYTQTYPGSNGYTPTNATHKFIRQVWNSAIVPLATIPSGVCSGRTDGMCDLTSWTNYQSTYAAELAQYQYACFGNYTNVGGNGNGSVTAI